MATIKELPRVSEKDKAFSIECAEEFLEHCKNGKIKTFCICWIDTHDFVKSSDMSYSGLELIGLLQVVIEGRVKKIRQE